MRATEQNAPRGPESSSPRPAPDENSTSPAGKSFQALLDRPIEFQVIQFPAQGSPLLSLEDMSKMFTVGEVCKLFNVPRWLFEDNRGKRRYLRRYFNRGRRKTAKP